MHGCLCFVCRCLVVAAHRDVMVTLRTRLLCSRLHHLSRHLPQAHLLLMSLIWSTVVWLENICVMASDIWWGECIPLNLILKNKRKICTNLWEVNLTLIESNCVIVNHCSHSTEPPTATEYVLPQMKGIFLVLKFIPEQLRSHHHQNPAMFL